LRDSLLAIPGVVSIVGQGVYWEDVEDFVEYPYILISHISGGYEQRTQSESVDVYYKVCGYTTNKLTADALRKAIAILHKTNLVTTAYSNVFGYGLIRQTISIYRSDLAQNVRYFESGGIYRLRFTVLEN
jgi:hypothetical protein